MPKSTYVTLAHNRKQKFFYFGCSLVRRFYCKINKNNNGTDGQTDGQTECDAICGPLGGGPHNKYTGYFAGGTVTVHRCRVVTALSVRACDSIDNLILCCANVLQIILNTERLLIDMLAAKIAEYKIIKRV